VEVTVELGIQTERRALLTPQQVSEYLGVPPGTLANWRYLGRGPAFVHLGRHVRYREVDVDEWVEAHLSDAGGASDRR
jgi:excisionase family DNA binding protein